MTLKRGYYETEYGNIAYLSSPTARTAKDVDANERVPVAMLERYIGTTMQEAELAVKPVPRNVQ